MKTLLVRASLSILLTAGMPLASTRIHAESRCPGNIAAEQPRVVAGALLVIPVRINHAGPFDFMVDTGSQLNVIDPALAAELGLKSQGTVGLVATASYRQASVTVLDSLEAGSHAVSKPLVLVQDLSPIQAADPRIRGVLGENFLAHFDVLIDYRRRLVCLDEAKMLEGGLRGEHVPLVSPRDPENQVPFSERLVISVHLSDAGNREILLQLDSGSDGPILYAGNRKLQESLLKRARLQGPEVGEPRRAFAVLPPQDMRVGDRVVHNVPFVTPVRAAADVPDREEDGILATVLFERVFINHTERYVILNPR
jgi:Aspartyl protease